MVHKPTGPYSEELHPKEQQVDKQRPIVLFDLKSKEKSQRKTAAKAHTDNKGEIYPVKVLSGWHLPIEDFFRINADHAKHLQEWCDIQNKKNPQRKMQVVHFGRPLNTFEVLKELEKEKLYAANAGELISLCTKYPQVHGKFAILALGQTWLDARGGIHVLSVQKHMQKRYLVMSPFDSVWDASCRFAAVYV